MRKKLRKLPDPFLGSDFVEPLRRFPRRQFALPQQPAVDVSQIVRPIVRHGVEGAAAHIAKHGSAHTDAIVAEDGAAAERFVALVDSAIVLINASTQYADGGEFGMGAEIGISTDKFHARGPVGVEQLTSYKYLVHGSGQIRA